MKEQLSEFKKEDKIKINYKDCFVAICPNGGLIAICKKKGSGSVGLGGQISGSFSNYIHNTTSIKIYALNHGHHTLHFL